MGGGGGTRGHYTLAMKINIDSIRTRIETVADGQSASTVQQQRYPAVKVTRSAHHNT